MVRAVAVDPLQETAQRALMQALAMGGNTAAATQVYRELRLRLHRELNAAPDPETQALYQQLKHSHPEIIKRYYDDADFAKAMLPYCSRCSYWSLNRRSVMASRSRSSRSVSTNVSYAMRRPSFAAEFGVNGPMGAP